MDVYLDGKVPVQFPDNATENDIAAFFQGQKMRGGGIWDNAFQLANQLGQMTQQPAQAQQTVAGQFPVFGNAVGLSQAQYQNMNETFQGVGQQQIQQQQLAQQNQQFNAAQAMEQRAQTQAQLQSEKDRAQQLKLEQQRFQNDQQMEKMRIDRQMALEKAKADREQQDKKDELSRGTVASGVGGQQLVRRINPDTGQWEVIPLNEPIFAPRGGGGGRGGAGAGGASGMEYSGGYRWIKDDTVPGGWRKLGDASAGGQQPGYHEIFKAEDDGMGNTTWLDRYGNRLVSGQGWTDIGAPQQAAVSAATDTPPAVAAPAPAGGGLNLGTGKETGASAAVKGAQAGAAPQAAAQDYSGKVDTSGMTGPSMASRIGELLGGIKTDTNPGLEPGYTPKSTTPAIPPKLTPEVQAVVDAVMQPKKLQGDMVTNMDSLGVIPEGTTTLIEGKLHKMVNGEWRPVNAK